MKSVCKSILLLAIYFFCMHAHAQHAAAIRAVARAQQKQILIRWGASNAQAWRALNKYGFSVSRFTVIRDKSMLAKPERKDIGVFKPKALALWETLVNQDENAAIIAQALYGDSFDVSGKDDQGILSTVNKAQEAEQRFALSLYAADRSFEAALFAGWGLVDADVKQNEKYLYRIKSLVPANVLFIDSTAVFISPADFKPLPAVTDIAAFFGDKAATLSWDYNGLKDYYNAYFIERSSDGTNFYRVTERPVTKISEQGNKRAAARVHYVDTLGMNNVKYYYRVRGVTTFGEVGPPSEAVSGIGKKMLTYVPHIIRSVVDETGSLLIEWEFDDAGNSLIKSFTLNQSQTEQGPYFPVIENIGATKRSLRYDKLFPANYFTITAVAIDGESRTSMPVLVQPLDSIPPQAPVGVKVKIDSSGVAIISWTPNTEKDLHGYKVFRMYSRNSELTPLTDSIFLGTSFVDTVSMRLTNRKVFYAVTALDKRYNQSKFSALITALKPDVVPPTSPVFTKYELFDYQVKLSWADSHDEDVASHSLFRKADTEKDWRLVAKFNASTPGKYTDVAVQRGHLYTYTLVSKDSSGLESLPATPVSIKVAGDPDDITVNMFNAYVDRDKHYIELFWKDGLNNVEEYQLYRQKKGEPVTLWRIMKQHERRTVDEALAVNTEYTYGIRVVTKAGQMSRMKWVVVKY
ncbi:MAG TPA: hypothetical protein VIM75_22105 [Ohtaekwangia sp.]|uniref:fibronectin type III domain-containing protein n=1 Tax=Ohtaekwangia sp. TaxID=2066019 RepID=UPI002F94D578